MIVVPVNPAEIPFGVFTARKQGSLVSISDELLADIPFVRTRTITDPEWAIYIARLLAGRTLLNSVGASPIEKSRLTRTIKRALRGNPHFTWVAA